MPSRFFFDRGSSHKRLAVTSPLPPGLTANVAPKAMSEMCGAALAGEKTEAEVIDGLLIGLHNDLFLEANPIPVKWAVGKQGLIEDGIRLPLTQFSEKFKSKLLASMEVAGSI